MKFKIILIGRNLAGKRTLNQILFKWRSLFVQSLVFLSCYWFHSLLTVLARRPSPLPGKSVQCPTGRYIWPPFSEKDQEQLIRRHQIKRDSSYSGWKRMHCQVFTGLAGRKINRSTWSGTTKMSASLQGLIPRWTVWNSSLPLKIRFTFFTS